MHQSTLDGEILPNKFSCQQTLLLLNFSLHELGGSRKTPIMILIFQYTDKTAVFLKVMSVTSLIGQEFYFELCRNVFLNTADEVQGHRRKDSG